MSEVSPVLFWPSLSFAGDVEVKAQFNWDIKPQLKAKLVKVKAEIVTCMNENGLCIASDVVGTTQAQQQQQLLFDVVSNQLTQRRTPTRVLYVDDTGKFTQGCA